METTVLNLDKGILRSSEVRVGQYVRIGSFSMSRLFDCNSAKSGLSLESYDVQVGNPVKVIIEILSLNCFWLFN